MQPETTDERTCRPEDMQPSRHCLDLVTNFPSPNGLFAGAAVIVLHDTAKYTWQVALLHQTDVPSNFVAPHWFLGIESVVLRGGPPLLPIDTATRHCNKTLQQDMEGRLYCLLKGSPVSESGVQSRVEWAREWSGHVTSAHVTSGHVLCQ